MNLKSYLSTLKRGASTSLALNLGISTSYLSQLASGRAPISAARCISIEQFTNGAITRRDLRPDDWHLIWPELAE